MKGLEQSQQQVRPPFQQKYAQDEDEKDDKLPKYQILHFGDGQQDVYLTKEDEKHELLENFEVEDEEFLFSQSQSDVLMTKFEEYRKGYHNFIVQVKRQYNLRNRTIGRNVTKK